ncbi:hypothetical protein MGYG_02168 [Nannizzia gypsea CBS 118893]|uniref:Uncharacterized protein n=1 Tax=Arthroderma gypseum (strain ATCC MYA-4604 / CBS 118893) TaxID=535722 RepID=E4UQ22_ARTGP|nr:hypothetical protein MGYG_02168 [Nannizzia gypsea CBS 118893]EFQ99156.1 hypothetical protein MGYG_02168 [Nannizzia gypsea CBS 118893]
MTLDPRLLSIPSARPSPGLMIPYQHQHILPAATDDQGNTTDRRTMPIPRCIIMDIPQDVVHATNIARRKADAAYRGFLYIERRYKERFYRLCPQEPRMRALKHLRSIDRLFEWGPRRGFTADPPKIPTCGVKFYVEEAAYLRYTNSFRLCRQEFLEGSYRTWIKSDVYLRNFVDNVPMSMPVRLLFMRWWNAYRDEMRTWEEKIETLVLPSWTTIIKELRGTIEECLDLEKEWDRWV